MGNGTSSTGGPAIANDIELEWKAVQGQDSGQVPSPREGHTVVAIGTCLYLFGGGANDPNTGPFQSNELFVFDAVRGQWSQPTMQGEVPEARTGAAGAAIGDRLFIFGGFNSNRGWLNDFYVLDTNNFTWSQIPAFDNAPSPRDKLRCISIGPKLYFFGGFGPQASRDDPEEDAATFGWFDEVYCFDTESGTWTREEIAGTPPSARAAFGMCAMGDLIVIMGGRDTSQRINDVHVLDLSQRSWQQITVHGAYPEARSFHTCTTVDANRAILFGGLNPTNIHLNDVHILVHISGADWAWMQPKSVTNAIAARGFHNSVNINNKLVVFGGSADFDADIHECKTYLNDLQLMDLEVPPPPPPAQMETEQPQQEQPQQQSEQQQP